MRGAAGWCVERVVPHALQVGGLFILFVVMSLPGTTSAAPVSTPQTSPQPAPQSVDSRPVAPEQTIHLIRESTSDGPSELLAERVLPPPPSVYGDAQVVAFYGYPNNPRMGALGAYRTIDAAADAVSVVASEYDALNGERDVIPALHLIVAVAQPRPEDDGTYLNRMSRAKIEEYVTITRQRGMLLILDLQIGWGDPLAETQQIGWALTKSWVHLALDPEWATRLAGVAPGEVIGSLAAVDVNAVQQYLAEIVYEYRLPPKTLVLHQFQRQMLRDPENYLDLSGVELVIDMDGFGGEYAKLMNYEIFSLAEYAERPAIKLFYEQDTPIMTPQRIQFLDDPPDLVIYQ